MTSVASGGSPYSGTTLNTVTAVSPTDERVGAADREPVRGEHPGGPPEQAGPVQRDHGDLGPVDDRGRAAVGDQRELVLAQRGGLGHGVAVQHGADPAHQVGDQARLPVVPRRRAGGQPVGRGQRVQQLKQRPACRPSSATCCTVIGSSRSRRVATVGQQQVVADRRGDQLARPASPRPTRLAHVARHHLAGDAVVARPALADVVQQRGEQQQVGPGHVAGRARRRWRRTRPGAGRR